MVQLTCIYTKSGDKGRTSLGSGKRVYKDALRIQALGDLDETNAALGCLNVHAPPHLTKEILSIQNDLFDAGADLCLPLEDDLERKKLRISDGHVKRLESFIDSHNLSLAPLESFVLPGGCVAAAFAHLARTVTRRAERSLIKLSKKEIINPALKQYLNRLSDYLFVIGRTCNVPEEGDILWKPGENLQRE